MSQLSPEDRQQLVKHLKAKWGSVNHAYQVGLGGGADGWGWLWSLAAEGRQYPG